MKQLFSKAGMSSFAFIAVVIILLGVGAIEAFNSFKEDRARTEQIKNSGDPIYLIVEQDFDWKSSVKSINDFKWKDGKEYSYDKNKSIDEQVLPDFIKLTENGEKYPEKSCSEKYDVCGALIRVKDANTGEVINTVKDEDIMGNGQTLFSMAGTLFYEETTTTSEREWKNDLNQDPSVQQPYTDIIYDIEIYTIQDEEKVIQATISGDFHKEWLLGISRFGWSEDIYETVGQGISVRSFISLREW